MFLTFWVLHVMWDPKSASFEKCWYQYFTRKIANNFYAIPQVKGTPLHPQMGLHVCTHFLVKRDKQWRLINDTFPFKMCNVFNNVITSFILNSP